MVANYQGKPRTLDHLLDRAAGVNALQAHALGHWAEIHDREIGDHEFWTLLRRDSQVFP